MKYSYLNQRVCIFIIPLPFFHGHQKQPFELDSLNLQKLMNLPTTAFIEYNILTQSNKISVFRCTQFLSTS